MVLVQICATQVVTTAHSDRMEPTVLSCRSVTVATPTPASSTCSPPPRSRGGSESVSVRSAVRFPSPPPSPFAHSSSGFQVPLRPGGSTWCLLWTLSLANLLSYPRGWVENDAHRQQKSCILLNGSADTHTSDTGH